MTAQRASPGMALTIRPAAPMDAEAIADLYLASRADAFPYLTKVQSDADTRAWIADVVVARWGAWLAVVRDRIIGFLSVVGEDLGQLSLAPGWRRVRIGTALLEKA